MIKRRLSIKSDKNDTVASNFLNWNLGTRSTASLHILVHILCTSVTTRRILVRDQWCVITSWVLSGIFLRNPIEVKKFTNWLISLAIVVAYSDLSPDLISKNLPYDCVSDKRKIYWIKFFGIYRINIAKAINKLNYFSCIQLVKKEQIRR